MSAEILILPVARSDQTADQMRARGFDVLVGDKAPRVVEANRPKGLADMHAALIRQHYRDQGWMK